MRTEPLSWVCAGVRPVALCEGAQAAALPGAGVQGAADHGQQLLLQGLPGDRVPEAPLRQRPRVPGARRRAPALACAARQSCLNGKPVPMAWPTCGDLAGREVPAIFVRGPCSAGRCLGSPTALHLAPSSTTAALSKASTSRLTPPPAARSRARGARSRRLRRDRAPQRPGLGRRRARCHARQSERSR